MPLSIVRAGNGHEDRLGPDGLMHDFMVFEVQVIEADRPDVGRLQAFLNHVNGYLFAHEVFVFLRVRTIIRGEPTFRPRTPPRIRERPQRMTEMELDE